MHKEFDKSLVYLLIFTAISSLLAYRIVVKAYDGIITDDYEVQIIKAR
jgi:hypothetical protein